jgi:hypothetical protein
MVTELSEFSRVLKQDLKQDVGGYDVAGYASYQFAVPLFTTTVQFQAVMTHDLNMAPLNFHISMGNGGELSLSYTHGPGLDDESSVSTELTVDVHEKDKAQKWNPNNSDRSLGFVLPENPSCSSMISASSSSSTISSSTASSSKKKKGQVLAISEGSKVSFYTRVSSKRIRPRDSLSEEEIEATWYSADEMQCIRKDNIRTLRMMLTEVMLEEEEGEVCFRGLEYKSGLPSKARKDRKKNLRNSVLDEQEFHRQLNIINPEAIAEISKEYSAPCVTAAIEAAEMDHTLDFDEWKLYFDEERCVYSNDTGTSKKGCWRKESVPIARTLSFLARLKTGQNI